MKEGNKDSIVRSSSSLIFDTYSEGESPPVKSGSSIKDSAFTGIILVRINKAAKINVVFKTLLVFIICSANPSF